MTAFINDNGVFREIRTPPFILDNGVWKKARAGWILDNGVWKPIWKTKVIHVNSQILSSCNVGIDHLGALYIDFKNGTIQMRFYNYYGGWEAPFNYITGAGAYIDAGAYYRGTDTRNYIYKVPASNYKLENIDEYNSIVMLLGNAGGRTGVSISQQPSAANGYIGVLNFNDPWYSGGNVVINISLNAN